MYSSKEDYFFTHLMNKNPLMIFIGKNIVIDKLSIFGLNPGDKICQVGNNRGTGAGSGMAGLNRFDNFNPYITYVGVRHEKTIKGRLLMFKVRDEDKPQIVKADDDYFISYEIINEDIEPELKLYDHRLKVPCMYRPIFTHYKINNQ